MDSSQEYYMKLLKDLINLIWNQIQSPNQPTDIEGSHTFQIFSEGYNNPSKSTTSYLYNPMKYISSI